MYVFIYVPCTYVYISNKGHPQNHTYHTHVSYELGHCHTCAITPYPVCPVQCRSRRHCDVRTGRRYSCGDLLFWHNGMTKLHAGRSDLDSSSRWVMGKISAGSTRRFQDPPNRPNPKIRFYEVEVPIGKFLEIFKRKDRSNGSPK